MKLTDKPVPNDSNAVRTIEDVVFVMNPDTSELHSFNEVGARIWQLLDGSRTVADVAGMIVEEYDVDEATAQQDVIDFLKALHEKNLVNV